MVREASVYAFADPVFFDSPERADCNESSEFSAFSPPPSGWVRSERRIWISYHPENLELPEQGWKIHISATPRNAAEVLAAVAGFCHTAGTAFKHLRSVYVLTAMNTKYAPRSASGKFITVYPRDTDELRYCAEGLAQLLDGSSGPYILTDCRWGKGPVYFRYGAFVEHRCWTADGQHLPALRHPSGELVPDSRRPGFHVPEWADIPDFLRSHIEERRSAAGGFDFEITEALHFSNGGGVYGAVRSSDRGDVVLKEARPHAGLEWDGRDALARLENEHRVLTLLDSVPGVPRSFGISYVSDHGFLAMQRMPGITLHRWVALHHPMLNIRFLTREGLRDYVTRADRIWSGITALVGRIHEEGVVFGDLHPSNILIDSEDESLGLVDFEQSFPAGAELRPTMGFPGFVPPHKSGIAIDEHCLAVLRLWFYIPNLVVLGMCPDKLDSLINEAEELFPLPEQFGASVRAGALHGAGDAAAQTRSPRPVTASPDVELRASADWPTVRRSIADALEAAATPERSDRLIPGDYQQFDAEPGCFAYDAAGALWSLSMAGEPIRPEHEKWLRERARGTFVRPGFYDGAHGIAFTLDHLGYRELAEDVVDKVRPDIEAITDITLFGGLSGIGLNMLHMFGGESEYLVRILALADRVCDALSDGARHGIDGVPGAGSRAGLLRGWSGAALFLLRIYEKTGRRVYLDEAVRALHRDLDLCVTTPEGALHVDGGFRTLPYVDVGTAGIGLVVDVLRRLSDNERIHGALPRLALATRSPQVADSQLFNGRAGLLGAAHALREHGGEAGVDPVAEHLQHLHVHALAFHGHVAFPGTGGLRMSMDLASGNAGLLLALSFVQRGGHPLLPFLDPSRVEVGAEATATAPAPAFLPSDR